MKNYQCIISLTLLQLTLGIHTSIRKGQTVIFNLHEFSLGTINSIEWKYHTINQTILLARINLNRKHSKMFSKRTGMQIKENGTLYIEDIKDEDSGNYSCTIIFHDQRVETEHIFLQVLNDLKTEPANSTLYTTTLKPSVETLVPGTTLIAIPVCSALAILLIVATIFIFKCRNKCCTSEEPIYANKTAYNSRK